MLFNVPEILKLQILGQRKQWHATEKCNRHFTIKETLRFLFLNI